MNDQRCVIIKIDTMNWKLPVVVGALAVALAVLGLLEVFEPMNSRVVLATVGGFGVLYGLDLRGRHNEYIARDVERMLAERRQRNTGEES